MEDLYLKTTSGKIPIEKAQIDKYDLKSGNISPNNGYHVVDKDGNEKKDIKKEKLSDNHTIDEMYAEDTIFTTAEILDIAQGVDAENPLS